MIQINLLLEDSFASRQRINEPQKSDESVEAEWYMEDRKSVV